MFNKSQILDFLSVLINKKEDRGDEEVYPDNVKYMAFISHYKAIWNDPPLTPGFSENQNSGTYALIPGAKNILYAGRLDVDYEEPYIWALQYPFDIKEIRFILNKTKYASKAELRYHKSEGFYIHFDNERARLPFEKYYSFDSIDYDIQNTLELALLRSSDWSQEEKHYNLIPYLRAMFSFEEGVEVCAEKAGLENHIQTETHAYGTTEQNNLAARMFVSNGIRMEDKAKAFLVEEQDEQSLVLRKSESVLFIDLKEKEMVAAPPMVQTKLTLTGESLKRFVGFCKLIDYLDNSKSNGLEEFQNSIFIIISNGKIRFFCMSASGRDMAEYQEDIEGYEDNVFFLGKDSPVISLAAKAKRVDIDLEEKVISVKNKRGKELDWDELLCAKDTDAGDKASGNRLADRVIKEVLPQYNTQPNLGVVEIRVDLKDLRASRCFAFEGKEFLIGKASNYIADVIGEEGYRTFIVENIESGEFYPFIHFWKEDSVVVINGKIE